MSKDGYMSESYEYHLGVGHGESLSPFLLILYINDMEEHMQQNGAQGITVTIDSVRLFILLYTDDAVLFAENEHGLQEAINHLASYYGN